MLKCLRQEAGERMRCHGLAFVPFVPGTVIQAIADSREVHCEDAPDYGDGRRRRHVGEQLHG